MSFEEIYKELSRIHRSKLIKLRNKTIFKLIVAFVIVVALSFASIHFLKDELFTLMIQFFLIGCFVVMIIASKQPYVEYFRKNVAVAFIALVNESLSYSIVPQDKDAVLEMYRTPLFDGGLRGATMNAIDTFGGSPGMSNHIVGQIEGRAFELCCLYMYSAHQKTTFKGMFVKMQVSKSLQGYVKISRKIKGLTRFDEWQHFISEKERTKVDVSEFDKDFYVGSNDPITPFRYLTHDVMELILNYKNELIDVQTRFNRNLLPQNPKRISLDIYWRGDEVFMRLGNKKMFEPTLRNPMCKDSLACCVSTLAFANEFNRIITKTIESTSV
ncbi:MAG: DUF3137 domain-containing protein [Oscillospiraceae bacterium]|nr:DUF3137 domain-containing protein [Oscillospiraceae bacterium]